MDMQREVVVVSGVRTAIGDFGGGLKDVAPTDLGAAQTIIRVNGTEKIRFKTGSMIFGPAAFISRMSQYLTLYPGDVLWMGTEGATENMKHGDVCEIEITGIGTLRNPVVRES